MGPLVWWRSSSNIGMGGKVRITLRHSRTGARRRVTSHSVTSAVCSFGPCVTRVSNPYDQFGFTGRCISHVHLSLGCESLGARSTEMGRLGDESMARSMEVAWLGCENLGARSTEVGRPGSGSMAGSTEVAWLGGRNWHRNRHRLGGGPRSDGLTLSLFPFNLILATEYWQHVEQLLDRPFITRSRCTADNKQTCSDDAPILDDTIRATAAYEFVPTVSVGSQSHHTTAITAYCHRHHRGSTVCAAETNADTPDTWRSKATTGAASRTDPLPRSSTQTAYSAGPRLTEDT